MRLRIARIAAIVAAAGLTACANQPAAHRVVTLNTRCGDRATAIISRNVDQITAHRYAAASRNAERAARISLSCAARESSSFARFSDRWRGANALVVAAELAHQASEPRRASRLLAEGYRIMHGLHPPKHLSALTSTLVAQTRDGAERDMHGQWSYW